MDHAHVPTIEIVQTFFAFIGVLLSWRAVVYAYKAEQDNRRLNVNGSTGIVARIRSRRARDFLFLHMVGLISGLYIIYWRVQNQAFVYFAPTLTRNFTIIVFQFMLMRATIQDIFDRKDVAEAVDAEDRLTARAKAKASVAIRVDGIDPSEATKLAQKTVVAAEDTLVETIKKDIVEAKETNGD